MWTAKIQPSEILFIQMAEVDGDKFKLQPHEYEF